MQETSVYIVSGYSMLRSMLCVFLREKCGMTVAGEAADGAVACRDILRLRPQLVLLDIDLPGLSGLELTARILADCPQTLVLAVTEKPEAAWLLEFLRLGGRGYLHDCCSEEDILRAVRKVLSGKLYLEDNGVQLVVAHACRRGGAQGAAVGADIPPQTLSDRERQILYLYAHGYNTADMASMLMITTSTVSTYIRRVREKLHLEHKSELVDYVNRHALDEDWQ